ncbi:MAG: hypothetical protein GQ574_14025 [Crocinitomix sp.]|nr:hypothetical protein [Crocinitomix sp.]
MRFRLYNTNNILVFKTDIKNFKKLELIAPIFNQQKDILNWSVDVEDVDKVLRIETKTSLTENKVIEILSNVGITSMVMTW